MVVGGGGSERVGVGAGCGKKIFSRFEKFELAAKKRKQQQGAEGGQETKKNEEPSRRMEQKLEQAQASRDRLATVARERRYVRVDQSSGAGPRETRVGGREGMCYDYE